MRNQASLRQESWAFVWVSVFCALLQLPALSQTADTGPFLVVEKEDHAGTVTYDVMTPAALRELQAEQREADARFSQGLRETIQAWQSNEETRRQPFPRSAMGRLSAKETGRFRSAGEAWESQGKLQEKAKASQARTGSKAERDAAAISLFEKTMAALRAAAAEEAAREREATVLKAAAQGQAVALVDLVPAGMEYGMVEDSPPEWQMQKGPGILDQHQYGRMNVHWPKGIKIVHEIAPDFALETGQRYSSFMTNVFAVGGEFITGVGLLLPINCCYHWLEYDVPPRAKKLSGELYLTDDVHGISFHLDLEMANRFPFTISVDGKQVFDFFMQRWSALDGSGQKLTSFSVDLPPGAQRVRFYAEATCNDNNHNNELVLHKAYFTF